MNAPITEKAEPLVSSRKLADINLKELKTLGPQIRIIRHYLDIPDSTLSERLGVTKPVMSLLERGRAIKDWPKHLPLILAHLGYNPEASLENLLHKITLDTQRYEACMSEVKTCDTEVLRHTIDEDLKVVVEGQGHIKTVAHRYNVPQEKLKRILKDNTKVLLNSLLPVIECFAAAVPSPDAVQSIIDKTTMPGELIPESGPQARLTIPAFESYSLVTDSSASTRTINKERVEAAVKALHEKAEAIRATQIKEVPKAPVKKREIPRGTLEAWLEQQYPTSEGAQPPESLYAHARRVAANLGDFSVEDMPIESEHTIAERIARKKLKKQEERDR